MERREEGERKASLLASIPRVDRLLETEGAARLLASHDRTLVLSEIRAVLDELRESIRKSAAASAQAADALERRLDEQAILEAVARRIEALFQPSLRKVVNATGVVLHTGLGRAVLPPSALEAIAREVAGYSYLEVDPETGERGERETHVAALLARLTGCEASCVVNNNAAATMILLAALARGREVVVSRGQLVEIGGSFRIPDVMKESGARLVEVGTTNRTRLADYERAIGPDTAALMLVHPSNYRIVGFTESVDRGELVELGRRRGIPVIEDLGSGALIDYAAHGLEGEPTVREILAAGVAIASFSGDKLLGGPQAGVIVGAAEHVQKIRRHPLYRAMRVDKVGFAALEAALKTYLDPRTLADSNPTFRMLSETAERIRTRAESLASTLAGCGAEVTVEEDVSRPGSGSLPTTELPTWVVTLRVPNLAAHDLARRLRLQRPAVMARIREDRVVLDPRTILPGEEPLVASAVQTALARP